MNSVGAILIYSSPYSPHINPIEYGFAALKKCLSKECHSIWNIDVAWTLEYAMRKCVLDMSATYSHCGYKYFGELDFSIPIDDPNLPVEWEELEGL